MLYQVARRQWNNTYSANTTNRYTVAPPVNGRVAVAAVWTMITAAQRATSVPDAASLPDHHHLPCLLPSPTGRDENKRHDMPDISQYAK